LATVAVSGNLNIILFLFSHFPEHSIGGYTDAWLAGADWIELDLNMSRDNELIVQHDICLK
jgi:glycerophosphoryl diester phosphodiesterase